MVEESKDCIAWWKKILIKSLLWLKKIMKSLRALQKVKFVIILLLEMLLVKVRYHCHVTGKYRCAELRDCDITVSLNYKIPVVFYILKNYEAHIIMKELGKFDFKINAIPNGLGKCMKFILDHKLVFAVSLQFLCSSLDSLVKNFSENDFKHLSQEFD